MTDTILSHRRLQAEQTTEQKAEAWAASLTTEQLDYMANSDIADIAVSTNNNVTVMCFKHRQELMRRADYPSGIKEQQHQKNRLVD